MDFATSTTPASCSAPVPRIATAMASSHIRMRPKSPMLTQSDTAPMVQKLVRLPTAPKTKASAKAPPVTQGASSAAPCGPNALLLAAAVGDALLGACRGAALRVLGDHLGEGGAGRGLVAHRFLRAGDAEQRIGRLVARRPDREQLALGGDGVLVIALPGVGEAHPVLGVRREAAVGIGDEETLHRRHGEP